MLTSYDIKVRGREAVQYGHQMIVDTKIIQMGMKAFPIINKILVLTR